LAFAWKIIYGQVSGRGGIKAALLLLQSTPPQNWQPMGDNCLDDHASNDHQRDDANTQFGKQITPKMCIGKQQMAKLQAQNRSQVEPPSQKKSKKKERNKTQAKRKIKKNTMGVDN